MAKPGDLPERRDTLTPAKRALLEQRLRGQVVSTAADAGLPRRRAGEPPVLSPGQQRLWFLHQLDPYTPAYNMFQALRIMGPLDSEALEQSLIEVVRRHEVLRTSFAIEDGRPLPVIVPDLPLTLSRLDLASLLQPQREARAHELATEEVSRPFDLRVGPLIRAVLLRLAEAEHVLMVTMHHIVSDEWSLEVLWREVAEFYEAIRAGRSAPLPELPLQYADYARWQRGRLAGPEAQRQLVRWRERLGGDLATLQIPTDHPRPMRQSFRGGLESLTLAPELTAALAQLSRREGVTTFVLLLAAFKTLLHRYTGQSDLVVGAPVTSRSRPELEGLIGFFINTLVLRSDLTGDPSFVELLKRVRTTALEAFANQDIPFETLVDELKPQRRLSHNPLFQVMFVLQRELTLVPFAPELRLRPFPVNAGAAKFDLTLFASERPGGLDLTFEYSTDLFERASILRMLEHLRVLLTGIARDPERPISELPLLTPGERRQLLVAWNATATDEPPHACIHHWFEAQEERNPDAVAAVFERRELTYRELNARANVLAHQLRALGVGPEVCVAVCLERSAEMLVGILGILKAGGAYVPLDPAYPQARIRFALEDAGAPVVLTQARLTARLPETGARVICLDGGERMAGDAANPAGSATAESPAYVIYTSGSTGSPKGVEVTHRNLVHSTRARLHYYADPPGRFLLLPSLAFDSSVAGIFWTLCTGGALVLPRQRAEQDVQGLAELIQRERVTHTLCLPSLYEVILEHASPRELASLRTAIVAGEACPPSLARLHHERLQGALLFNEYGPTEATVWSTVYQVPAVVQGPRVPIGRPIADARAYVLDAQRQPVPVGVAGELYLGGAGVSRGYLRRPDETEARFLTDPFAEEPGARLYRTGDLAHWLPDGNLDLLGRTDQQLKIRGHRIEPGEIEAALEQHPAVRESIVTMCAGNPAASDVDQGEQTHSDTDALLDALLALGAEEADDLLAAVERLRSAHPLLS